MNTLNSTQPAALTLATFVPETEQTGLLTSATTAKNGSLTMSAKRMSRAEYATANKLETKAADFSVKYRAYLISHQSKANIALAAMQDNGLYFTGLSVKTKKDGTASSGVIRFAAVPADKGNAAKALKDENEVLKARLAALEAKLLGDAPSEAPEAK